MWQEKHNQKSQMRNSQALLAKDQSPFMHVKSIQSVDPKLKSETIEKLNILNEIHDGGNSNSNIVFCADASLNVSMLY